MITYHRNQFLFLFLDAHVTTISSLKMVHSGCKSLTTATCDALYVAVYRHLRILSDQLIDDRIGGSTIVINIEIYVISISMGLSQIIALTIVAIVLY